MKKVKINYSDVNNMGDQLNKILIEKVFNIKVKRSSFHFSDMIAIGSGLGTYTYDYNQKKNVKKTISSLLVRKKTYVWGTGFISYNTNKQKFYKKNMEICAVRGNLTKQRVEKIVGKKLNIPTGDGGLLSSYLLDKLPKKKYDIGIIAHFREKSNPVFTELTKKFDNCIFIDVQDDPINVTKKIAMCEHIISSSLHGLIISDSLNIPNIHLVVSDKLLGDGYKFDDYYSSYNLSHKYISIDDIGKINLKYIEKNYKITKEMVERKKQELINCFPFK